MGAQPTLTKGCTFLIPAGPTVHLHFVCSNPAYYPSLVKECVLLVNLCSIYEDVSHDPTCVLSKGEHPFIKHESYIYYRKADIFGCDTIRRSLADGSFESHALCHDLVLDRILNGFAASSEVRPKIKAFHQKYCAF